MSERRGGALLSLFFFVTFASWLSDAPLLPELYPPRRGVLDTVPLWPLDLWTGLPVTALLWNRAVLYLLTLPSLIALFCFVLDRFTRLASGLLAGLLLAKLAFLSWDLRYLTGADVVHLAMTALFVTGRPRLPWLRAGLLVLGLVGCVTHRDAASLTGAVASLLWLAKAPRLRQLGVAVWLAVQAWHWATLSLSWPTSLAACGPLLLLGAVLLVPLEGPLQEGFGAGPGAWGPALVLGALLVGTATTGWLRVHDQSPGAEIRARIVMTRGPARLELQAEVPRARGWDPEVPVRVQGLALIDGERTRVGPLTEPLRLDGTLVFSPHRFRRASANLLADPLFYRSYAEWLQKTFHPDELEIELQVDGRQVMP